MATNFMENLDPSMTVARAGVSVTERGIMPSPHSHVRSDAQLHVPLYDPRSIAATSWKPQPAPPPPTETELREALAKAIEEHRAREEQLQAAEAAHARGQDHRRRAQAKMAEFLSLDAEVTASTKSALLAGADPKLSEALAEKINARARAIVEATAAETVLSELLADLARCSEAAGTASRALDIAACKVLACEADRLAQEHDELLAKARSISLCLLGADRLSTPLRVAMSNKVYAACRNIAHDHRSASEHLRTWQEQQRRLRSDPDAVIEISRPPPQVFEPVPPFVPTPTVVMQPLSAPAQQDDGDPHLADLAEQEADDAA
jgi:hypothetical protein